MHLYGHSGLDERVSLVDLGSSDAEFIQNS